MPKMKRNFFGEVPSFLRIVQEKLTGSRPRDPHSLRAGRTNRPKEKIQMNKTIKATLHGE